jgi:hypothetical protein
MKAEVFEQGGWRELEPVRRGVSTERRVVSPEKQQPDTVLQDAPYRAKRLSQVRDDISNIGRIIPYSLDWLNPPRVVVVKEKEAEPESLAGFLFDLLFGWLEDRMDNKK